MTTGQVPADPTADAIVGEKVFHEMWRKKISQTDMARHLGVSQTNVSRRLRGDTGWSVDDILTAAAVLRVQPGDLLPGPDDQYAIRDSNPEPADFASAPDAPSLKLATVLELPRRSHTHTTTTDGRGATVVRLEHHLPRGSRRTTPWQRDEVSS